MKTACLPLLKTLAFCFLLSTGFAQEVPIVAVGDTVRIKTIDLNIFRGKVIAQDSTVIKLETSLVGTVSIYQNAIKEIRVISFKNRDPLAMDLPVYIRDRSWRKNPNPTFAVVIPHSLDFGLDFIMLVSPTGFGLNKGTGYYQNTMLIYNHFGYGFTDHFSVNASISLNNFFDSDDRDHIYFMPKLAFP